MSLSFVRGDTAFWGIAVRDNKNTIKGQFVISNLDAAYHVATQQTLITNCAIGKDVFA